MLFCEDTSDEMERGLLERLRVWRLERRLSCGGRASSSLLARSRCRRSVVA